MLNLDELEQKLDKALDKETKESLLQFLSSKVPMCKHEGIWFKAGDRIEFSECMGDWSSTDRWKGNVCWYGGDDWSVSYIGDTVPIEDTYNVVLLKRK
jgi:hypothetical protein